MSGSSTYSDFAGGLGRNSLDVPVAGLAALAVATLAWAAPADDLVGIAGGSGALVRIALGGPAAFLLFGLVLVFLRRLDRPASASSLEEPAVPKARRRDRHPDAPPRRPISAAVELGEPGPESFTTETLPAWLGRASLAQEDVAADRSAGGAEPGLADGSMPDRTAADQARRDTVFGLMARLEKGYARREPVPAGTEDPSGKADPQSTSAGADRLQSAIHSLQRLAARRA
jgi:hypothetical protein